MSKNKLEDLINILKKLRAPNGCEWDRKQTHQSLIPYLLEETYEVVESIENKDMKGLKESPNMMYAVDVKEDKKDLISAVLHVDDTCRIQTVSKEVNEHFYNLIEEFYKLTGIPILFNTSFNLAGDPLVETIDDALKVLNDSEMEYCFMPELNSLIRL